MIFDIGVYRIDLGACRIDLGVYHFGLGVYLPRLAGCSERESAYESLWKSGEKSAIEKMIVCAGGKRAASLDSVRVGKGAAR